jgi:hypothetical protein
MSNYRVMVDSAGLILVETCDRESWEDYDKLCTAPGCDVVHCPCACHE